MDKVKDAFHQAYTGESKAALRLKIYAKKADEEGMPQMAKLFRVISFSEEIHGERALRMMREIKNTAEDNDDAAMLVFAQSKDVEDVHAKLYKEAMNHLMEDRETTYYVCST